MWVQTYSGGQFYPLDPREEDVNIEDIAHALSLQCRFNGHCRMFYSVAQHSVLVSEGIESLYVSDDVMMAALLHDAAEAYLPDVCGPIKGSWPGFDDIEQKLLGTIFRALGVEWPSYENLQMIKLLDKIALATEKRDLLEPLQVPWEESLSEPWVDWIVPWDCLTSEKVFLETFRSYKLKGEGI